MVDPIRRVEDDVRALAEIGEALALEAHGLGHVAAGRELVRTPRLAETPEQHGLGGSRYTSRYKAKELRWAMEFDSVADAYRVERQIHGWSRAKKEALMRGDFEAIKRLASRARKSRDEGVGG